MTRMALEIAGVTILIVLNHLVRWYVPGIGDYLADIALLVVAYIYGRAQTLAAIMRPDNS